MRVAAGGAYLPTAGAGQTRTAAARSGAAAKQGSPRPRRCGGALPGTTACLPTAHSPQRKPFGLGVAQTCCAGDSPIRPLRPVMWRRGRTAQAAGPGTRTQPVQWPWSTQDAWKTCGEQSGALQAPASGAHGTAAHEQSATKRQKAQDLRCPKAPCVCVYVRADVRAAGTSQVPWVRWETGHKSQGASCLPCWVGRTDDPTAATGRRAHENTRPDGSFPEFSLQGALGLTAGREEGASHPRLFHL